MFDKFLKKLQNYINQSLLLVNQPFIYKSLGKFTSFLLPSTTTTTLLDAKNIYIDVSIFAKHDNKTGIQRVIREVIIQCLQHPNLRAKIHFVIATQKTAYKSIGYQFRNNQITFDLEAIRQSTIVLKKNDVFFGLDFCPNIIPYHLTDFIKWKFYGAKFVWLLHDILPLTHPEWFTFNNTRNFKIWFNSLLLLSNQILCVSQTVKNQVIEFAQVHHSPLPNCTVIPLGYRFNSIDDEQRASAVVSPLCQSLQPYILMVSTLEPRKGHKEIIETFTYLWQAEYTDINLVLVGKQGWNVQKLILEIEQNAFYNKHLFWLTEVTDVQLIDLYLHAKGTIMASLDEGFGLPLIEAIGMNKHILLRNIPIFREVGANKYNLTYFHADNSNLIAITQEWLNKTIQLPTQHNNILDTIDFGWRATMKQILSIEL